MLVDLEGADRVNKAPQGQFRCWTANTLQDSKYTTASDMELVGHLMDITFKSTHAQELQGLLTASDPQQRPSAADALAQTWFSSTEVV
jgi:hypothetical protein